MAVRKWSVSIDEDLARRVEEHVGPRGLSRFVATAISHELDRAALDGYLSELEEEFGKVPAHVQRLLDDAWPD